MPEMLVNNKGDNRSLFLEGYKTSERVGVAVTYKRHTEEVLGLNPDRVVVVYLSPHAYVPSPIIPPF
jgi:hypothetical protein